jgi:hypothetical protein
MKQTSRYGWVVKLGGAILALFLVSPSYAQLMLAHEGHHDAGGCTISDAEFPIAFSGYEVPDNNLPPLHSYCSNIPTPGRVQLAIELSDWDSREIPLAVRLVEAGHGGHGDDHGSAAVSTEVASAKEDEDDHAGHDMDEHDGHEGHDDHVMEHDGPGGTDPSAAEHGINYIPYMKHRSGIVVVHATLDKGHYEILLERHDDDAGNVVVAGRIPFSVGGSGGHGGHGGGIGLMQFILLLLVAVGGGFYFMHRRKAKAKASAEKS